MVFVYLIRNVDTGRLKIGIAEDVNQRLRDLQNAAGHRLELLGSLEFETRELARAKEAALHQRFASQRRIGEWFEPNEEMLTFADVVSTPAPKSAQFQIMRPAPILENSESETSTETPKRQSPTLTPAKSVIATTTPERKI